MKPGRTNKLDVGKMVPNFKLPATGNQSISRGSLRGRPLILYFYPKDGTSGCIAEGCAFRDRHRELKKLGAVVLGVSRDPPASHERFKAKYDFPFDLLSDSEGKLCQLFDVLKEKNLYGRKVLGIERSTFLIDPRGVLRRAWRKVKVDGHVGDVLDALKSL